MPTKSFHNNIVNQRLTAFHFPDSGANLVTVFPRSKKDFRLVSTCRESSNVGNQVFGEAAGNLRDYTRDAGADVKDAPLI